MLFAMGKAKAISTKLVLNRWPTVADVTAISQFVNYLDRAATK